jgi:hypothetical protein
MLQKLTSDILYKCIQELKKEENKVKLNENIVEPVISNLTERLYPYLIILFIMYILVIILVISILIIILFNKKKI